MKFDINIFHIYFDFLLFFYRRYIAYEFQKKMETNFSEDDVQYSIEEDIPQQETSYDCGIFICEYAEQISRNSPLNISNDSEKIRKRIRMEIKCVTLQN